ncbi:MAG: response regulator [Adhaeribacter sp.]
MEKKSQILLIDDNLTTIRLNKMVIEKVEDSAEILTATDGRVALNLLQDCEQEGLPFPNLIFVDLKMPAMDGLEFFEKFRDLFRSRLADTKVVMLTTSLNYEDLQKAMAAGITHYLNKPLTTMKVKEVFS